MIPGGIIGNHIRLSLTTFESPVLSLFMYTHPALSSFSFSCISLSLTCSSQRHSGSLNAWSHLRSSFLNLCGGHLRDGLPPLMPSRCPTGSCLKLAPCPDPMVPVVWPSPAHFSHLGLLTSKYRIRKKKEIKIELWINY